MSQASSDFLEHHGVKGMKWGVRKKDGVDKRIKTLEREIESGKLVYSTKTRKGDTLNVVKTGEKNNVQSYNLKNSIGVRVGTLILENKSKDEMSLDWIGVLKNHRRNGYAEAAMQGVINEAQKRGVKKITLDATDQGLPLYERIGFKKTSDGSTVADRWLEGTYELLLKDLKHSEVDNDLAKAIADAIVFEIDKLNDGTEVNTMSDTEDFLEHYGVKGMKWGKRKNRVSSEPGSSDHESYSKTSAKIKSKGVKSLSNKELQDYLTRVDLENRYAKVSGGTPKKKAVDFIKKQGGQILASAIQQAAQNMIRAQLKKHLG